MFSEEDAEYNEALRMGPICAIVLEGGKDAKIGMVIVISICGSSLKLMEHSILMLLQAFYHDATKSVRLAEFFDNSAMDLLESMVIQVKPSQFYLVAYCVDSRH